MKDNKYTPTSFSNLKKIIDLPFFFALILGLAPRKTFPAAASGH
jgi:hypothetical protein